MNNFANIVRRFREEEDGAAMVEYSILVGVISAAAITAIIMISNYVTAAFSGLCDDLNAAGGSAPTCS